MFINHFVFAHNFYTIENDGLLLLIEHFNLSLGFSKLLDSEGQFSLQHLFLQLL